MNSVQHPTVKPPTLGSGLKTAYCTSCGETFSTPANFDRHRRGGECASPGDVGLLLADNGRWQMPGREADE